MRINIYSQELTQEVELVDQRSNTGRDYQGVRMFLHSSDKLHHPPEDDDRSGVTFWLPKSNTRRRDLAQTFRNMADMIDHAPIQTMKYEDKDRLASVAE